MDLRYLGVGLIFIILCSGFIIATDIIDLKIDDKTEISLFDKTLPTLVYDNEIQITPYLDEKTEYTDFDWVIETKEVYDEKLDKNIIEETKAFYPVPKTPLSLIEFHWFVNKLQTEKTCIKLNPYYSTCSYEELDFSTFESKNEITNKTIKPIYEEDKTGIQKIIGYLISYYGIISNLDPVMNLVYDSSDDIIFSNRTEGSTQGARIDAPVLFMDFNKPTENLTASDPDYNDYVQDNSLYNNYGLSGSGTNSSRAPTYNSSCTAFSGSGGCYEFDGVDDYIDIGGIVSVISGNSQGTISVWLKSPDLSTTRAFFSIGDGDSTQNYFEFYLSTAGLAKLYFYAGGVNIINLQSTSAVDDNVWHNLILTQNGTTSLMYVDGIVQADTDSGEWFNDLSGLSHSRIGNNRYNNGDAEHFNGSIDDVRIWDRALSSDEISALYSDSAFIGKYSKSGDFKSLVFYNSTSIYWNTTFYMANSSGQGVDLTDANLVSYWALDENYRDSKGTNHGTPFGTNNATGLSSDAMRFDGVDDYVVTSTDIGDDLGNLAKFSISLWYNEPINNNNKGIFGISTLSNERGVSIIKSPTTGKIQVLINDLDFSLISVTSPAINTWHHVVLTYNSTNVTIYLDGVEDKAGSYTTPVNFVGDKASMGTYYNTGQNFNGTIDEALIYNDTLTPAEIRNLYKTGLSQHANTNISLQTRTATSYNLTDTGLVSQWSFNADNNGTDEMGLNDGACDSSATCPTWGQDYGTVGGGYDFDGGDYINAGNDISLNITDAITVSAWVKGSNQLGPKGIVSKMKDGVSTRSWSIYSQGTTNKITIIITQNGGYPANAKLYTTSVIGLDDSWHHISFTYSSDILKVYVDGAEDTGVTKTTDNSVSSLYGSSVNLTIGGFSNPTNFFNGSIDEVRIYNRSLSASEVSDLYNLGTNYILWNNWSSEGNMQDGIYDESSEAGKFFQFKSIFTTNDTEVSAYLLNHSVEVGNLPAGGITMDALVDQTIYYTHSFSYDVDATGSSIHYFINDTSTFSINEDTGVIINSSALTIDTYYTLNVSANNSLGGYDSDIFHINSTSDLGTEGCRYFRIKNIFSKETLFEIDCNGNMELFGNAIFSGKVGIGTITPQNELNVIGDGNFTGNLIVGGNTGITGNYSVGDCWMAYSGGIIYETNCTAY